uniref:Uncharacterized protein n=1 Tax=Neospora caninum (strain Liverpool) TaxID=572307 RepID=A0A0F7URZ8_NEOCL|nr:TPA: hypothetical protein BN1204_065525 [Neospora caninum Liverpool]
MMGEGRKGSRETSPLSSSSLLFPSLLPPRSSDTPGISPRNCHASSSQSPPSPAHPLDALRPATREDLFAFLSSVSPSSEKKNAVLSSLAAFATSCAACTARCNRRLDAYRRFLSSLHSPLSSASSSSAQPESAAETHKADHRAAVEELVAEQMEFWQQRCLTACARERTSQLPSSPL